ncbi:MAG: hypothetical protein ACREMP_04890 [Candidatus Tyrphobacter sp.]
MPFVPRLFLKTGIVYLALTFVLGAVLLVLEALGRPVPFVIAIEHGHMGFVGWLVNTVIGVALWLLPLNRIAFPQEQGRYPEGLARASYVMLNVGLPLRLVVEPIFSAAPSPPARALLVLSAILQVFAILIAGSIAWRRVFPPPLRPNV